MLIDEKTKDILDIYNIKSDMIRSMLSKATNGKISVDDTDNFIDYLNVIVKVNKSKNNLDNRILGIYNLIKRYYKEYTKLNEVITKKRQSSN